MFSIETETTIGLRRSDLGGQGLSFSFIARVLQVQGLRSPEKTTGARAPASLTWLTGEEAGVAR